MISKKMGQALNEQINAELYSSYLYFSMVAYFESENLSGFAAWMKAQVLEELAHVQKLFDFINERGGRVVLKAVAKPDAEWDSPLAAFEAAYKHEQMVTGLINELVNLAIEEKDHATNSFLQWFVNEQVEEETTADNVVKQLRRAQGAPGALFMIDRELGQRVFTPPTAE